MEMSYTLLRIIRSIEDTTYHDSEEIKYEKPVIEIVEGGKSLEECQASLTKIREKIAFLTSLKQRKQDIYNKNKNKARSISDKQIYELEQEILENKEKDKRIDELYLGRNVWEGIDERVQSIHGEYLIIPCFYEELYSSVKY